VNLSASVVQLNKIYYESVEKTSNTTFLFSNYNNDELSIRK